MNNGTPPALQRFLDERRQNTLQRLALQVLDPHSIVLIGGGRVAHRAPELRHGWGEAGLAVANLNTSGRVLKK